MTKSCTEGVVGSVKACSLCSFSSGSCISVKYALNGCRKIRAGRFQPLRLGCMMTRSEILIGNCTFIFLAELSKILRQGFGPLQEMLCKCEIF